MPVRFLKPLYSNKPKRKERPNANDRGYTYRWQQYSARFLADHPLCASCLAEGRIEAATVVDHRIPVESAENPLFWDESNHQALSATCHQRKTNQDIAKGLTRGSRTTPITIVYGPPASGKSTYVRAHQQSGDLVLDIDLLYYALTGGTKDKPEALLPFVCHARDAVLERLARPSKIRKAWVMTCQRDQLAQISGDVIEIAATEAECLDRMTRDESRRDKADQETIIRSWFQANVRRSS